jgi:hypothetical protein
MYLQKVISKKNLEKKYFLLARKKIFSVGILKVTDEKSRIRYGSSDPDPYQNVIDARCQLLAATRRRLPR